MINEKTVWNTKTKKYTNEHEKSHNDGSRQYILDILQVNDYNSMLEMGVGSGILLDNLKKNEIKVNYTGIDASIKFIEVTKNKHPNANIIKHDFDKNLPFKDEQFDVVYARHVLEHVKHFKHILPEMIRVCKREMVVILFRPLIDGKTEINFRKHKGTYYNSYNKDKFLEVCKEAFGTVEVHESPNNLVGPSWNGLNWIIHCVKT